MTQFFHRTQLQSMIEKVNEEGVNLTAWEKQFMESITDYFDRGGTLSESQIEHLERIYTERVA